MTATGIQVIAVSFEGHRQHGEIYRSGLPVVPARRHEALPQGRALLHGQVRDREAQCAAGPARPVAPQAKMAGYGMQLREKQKVKRTYGVLENQFRRYFEAADRQKGVTGELLLQSLERRLDNVIYRLGSRDVARAGAPARAPRPLPRQRQEGGHPVVRRAVRATPWPCVRAASRTPSIKHAMEEVKGRGVPEWLTVEASGSSARISSAADAAADQPARAGTVNRRVVFEVSKAQLSRRSSKSSAAGQSPARSPSDLRREAGDITAGLAVRVTGQLAKGREQCCGKVFSGPSAWSSNVKP